MTSERYLESGSINLHFPSEMVNGKQLEDEIVKRRVPKRILYFSDGTLEEYSSEENEEESALLKKKNVAVNPTALTWGPWIWYQTIEASLKLLTMCDYLGESLAHFFGILSPKYEYEIEHYKQLMAEEENLKRQQDIEMMGWESPQGKNIVESECKLSANNLQVLVEERF